MKRLQPSDTSESVDGAKTRRHHASQTNGDKLDNNKTEHNDLLPKIGTMISTTTER